MAAFYDSPMVDIVWHMISAAGATKPAQHLATQVGTCYRCYRSIDT